MDDMVNNTGNNRIAVQTAGWYTQTTESALMQDCMFKETVHPKTKDLPLMFTFCSVWKILSRFSGQYNRNHVEYKGCQGSKKDNLYITSSLLKPFKSFVWQN